MTRWKSGQRCSVLGPLGNGFTLPEQAKSIAVLGRDVGIGPLLALVDEGAARGVMVYAFLSSRYQEVLEIASFDSCSCEAWFFPDGDKWQCGPFLTRRLEQIATEKTLDQIILAVYASFVHPAALLRRPTHWHPAYSRGSSIIGSVYGLWFGASVVSLNYMRMKANREGL